MNSYVPLVSNYHNTVNLSLLRQKRLRHIKIISALNLKILSKDFSVWFTLHRLDDEPLIIKNDNESITITNTSSNPFYISEKKRNNHNPKWSLTNLSKSCSIKRFEIRIWWFDLHQPTENAISNVNCTHLHLLFAQLVDLDLLDFYNDELLPPPSNTFSSKIQTNLLVLEIFAQKFCSLKGNQKETSLSEASSYLLLKNSVTKPLINSYSLNLMMRLHDFQRVMHETSSKICYLKQSCLNKFEAAAKLRQNQAEYIKKFNRVNNLR
jgi:hypothetical protein